MAAQENKYTDKNNSGENAEEGRGASKQAEGRTRVLHIGKMQNTVNKGDSTVRTQIDLNEVLNN